MAHRWMVRRKNTQPLAGTPDRGEVGKDLSQMTCMVADCEDDAVWNITALLSCGCKFNEDFCADHGRALWYRSGMVGMVCTTHEKPSPLTYHPMRIGKTRQVCLLCGSGCPAFNPKEPS